MIIALAIPKVAETIIGERTFGSMCLEIILDGFVPIDLAAATNSNSFNADNLLAKHDENYIPREIKNSLKKQGLWKGEYSD